MYEARLGVLLLSGESSLLLFGDGVSVLLFYLFSGRRLVRSLVVCGCRCARVFLIWCRSSESELRGLLCTDVMCVQYSYRCRCLSS